MERNRTGASFGDRSSNVAEQIRMTSKSRYANCP